MKNSFQNSIFIYFSQNQNNNHDSLHLMPSHKKKIILYAKHLCFQLKYIYACLLISVFLCVCVCTFFLNKYMTRKFIFQFLLRQSMYAYHICCSSEKHETNINKKFLMIHLRCF